MSETNLFNLTAILILVSISLGPFTMGPSIAQSNDFLAAPLTQGFAPSKPLITMFQVSSDFGPYVITPVTNETVFVIAFRQRDYKPPLSQIINYTIGQNPRFILPQPLNGTVPSDMVYDRGRNRVWFLAGENLTYYDPVSNKTTIEHSFSGDTAGYMAIDHSGRIWISLLISDKIAEYDPSNKQLNLYNPPTSGTGLGGVAVAPDNSVWFAEPFGAKIGHIVCTQASCNAPLEVTAPLGIHIVYLFQLTVGADDTVWFTDHGAGEFGSFNPATNEWKEFPIGYCAESYNAYCPIGLPNAISFDSNGRLWFSEHVAGRVAEFDPASQVLTEFTVPTTTPPYVWWMQPGPGNLVWFVAFSLGKIGYVNASVVVPMSVSAPTVVDLIQGQTGVVTASVLSPQSSVSLGMTANDNDAHFGIPASLYGNWTGSQIGPSNSPIASNVTITAAWNLSPGDRYISMTAYNGSLEVSAFVKVHVIAHYYLATSFAPFLGVGSVSAIAAGAFALYVRSRPRYKKSPVADTKANN